MEVRVPSRRAQAIALTAYGVVGLAVLVILAIVVLRSGTSALDALEAQQGAVVRLVEATDRMTATAEAGLQRASAGVARTADIADETAAFLGELAGSLDQMAGAMRFEIFGSQPLAGGAAGVERAAERARGAAEDLGVTATAARDGAADLEELTENLATVRDQLDSILSRLEAIDFDRLTAGLAGLVTLLAVLLAWLAVPAVVSLWVGLRWLLRDRRSTA
jgi:hypothetical protein